VVLTTANFGGSVISAGTIRQLLNSRIQIEQLRHDQVDGILPVLKITLP
jgi:hypothetical protein